MDLDGPPKGPVMAIGPVALLNIHSSAAAGRAAGSMNRALVASKIGEVCMGTRPLLWAQTPHRDCPQGYRRPGAIPPSQ
jgi:hypothetical protein